MERRRLMDAPHPILGDLRADGDGGWLGRYPMEGDFFDLYVSRPADYTEDDPPVAALEALAAVVIRMPELKANAVAAICAARQARLKWRAGPPAKDWSVVEARIDDGALWVSLHEYETDEYSLWLVQVEGPSEGWRVRRRPYIPYNGPPGEAGEPV